MGKRKSSKKPQAKIKAVLDKTFRCLFCQHNGTVTCKLDTKNRVARLDCKDCAQHFTTDINHLTEPIDVYSEWIDACAEANKDDGPSQPRKRAATSPAAAPPPRKERNLDDEDEDDDDDKDDLPDIPMPKKKKVAVDDDEEDDDDD
ncbi:Elf1-domain-containing protein [Meredithblackwellia eburnea MCA 4105]